MSEWIAYTVVRIAQTILKYQVRSFNNRHTKKADAWKLEKTFSVYRLTFSISTFLSFLLVNDCAESWFPVVLKLNSLQFFKPYSIWEKSHDSMCKIIAVKVNHFKKAKSTKIPKIPNLWKKTVRTVKIGLQRTFRRAIHQKETLFKCPNKKI